MAVPVGDAARAAVRALVDGVRADPGVPAAGRLRWAVGDNLHLTIRFLGPTAPARVADLAAAAAAAARHVDPFPIRLDGAGGFPDRARPRVIWLGIDAGRADLARLAAHLEDELAARGWERDARPFRVHLTLARADGIAGAGRAVAALADAAAGLDAAWTADRLVVYESELGRGPARYRPLSVAPLGSGALPLRDPVR